MKPAACLVVAVLLIASGCQGDHERAETARPTHWGYGGEDGPAAWASLDPKYALCGEGTHQSPIDIDDWSVAHTSPSRRRYREASLRIAHHEHTEDILDNGHTIQISYPAGSTVVFDGKIYELVQFHFHSPSEHTVEGRRFPLEMHLVHRSANGSIAVAGVFIEEGAHNAAFDHIVGNLPAEPGDEVHLEDVTVDIDELVPSAPATWHYKGSLTTPPCSEGVDWFLGVETVAMSAAQLEAFSSRLGRNNRPTQPRNGRTITKFEVR